MRATLRPEKLPVLVLILLAFAAALGCTRTPQEKEAKFLENGKSYLLRKDYRRAALQFKNAVQVMPRDADAYYQLGLAELADGNLTAAVNALRKATELNPGHAAAQVKLAELMALSGIKDVAEDGKKRMEDVLRSSPDNVDALDALAINEIQLGKWQDAQAHLQQALDKFPQSLNSAVALAKLDLRQRDPKGAEEVLKKAVKDAPRSPEAATALGQFYIMTSRWNEAEGQFQAALKINPKFGLGLVGLASAQIRVGHKDQAEQTYRVLSALPERAYRHLYAAYLLQEGKRDAAIKEFERVAKQDPGDRDARTRLVAAYLLANKLQDAERVLTTALKTNPKDVDALLQRSQILLRSGKQKEAEGDVGKVLQYQPDSARGHYLLSEVYRARGDSLRERQEIDEAVHFDPSFLKARIDLAEILLEKNSAKAALDTLDAAPDQQKRILALVIQRNWALLAIGDQAEARKWVDRGLRVARAPDLLTQDSILKLRQRNYAGARASASEVLKRDPEDLPALRVVAASYVAQKQPAAALRALQEQAAKYPKSVAIQQFVGEWLLSRGELVQARAAFTAARAANPNSTDVNMALAQVSVSEGKLDEARKRLTDILSSNSANPEAHLWLGTIEAKAGNYGPAIEHFRKVLEADDTNVPALNNLAYLLANFANHADEALGFAQRARELAPNNVDTEGTLGWVLYRKGLYEIARKYLQQAVTEDGENSTQNAAIRRYHLGMAYLKLGDQESALKAMASALKINPNLRETETTN
jgi:tetratricopeptide (TPR) repeat protein